MNAKKFALALLLASPLLAQRWEIGLTATQQEYNSASALGTTVQPDTKMNYSIRAGWSMIDAGPLLFQLNVGYSPEVSTNISVSTVGLPSTGIPGSFDSKYYSAGLAIYFKMLIELGIGLDYRNETLSAAISGINQSTTYGRGWARLNIGFAFPLPVVKPFIGAEVAAPLTSQSYSATASDAENLKSLAPKLQYGLYGGIRF